MIIPDVVPLRLLLVEDSSDDQVIIQANLQRGIDRYGSVLGLLAFSMTHVSTMAAARSEIAEKPFDLILLDLNLPDSTGIDTLDAIRDAAADVPLIVLSVMEDMKTILHSSLAGGDDYLPKREITPERLVRIVLSCLLRKRLS